MSDEYCVLESDLWLVVPSHATGSSMEGTREYTWCIDRSRGIPRERLSSRCIVARDERHAEKLAAELNARNEAF